VIVQLTGKLIEKNETSLVINVHGLYYEVMIPVSILQRIDQHADKDGNINLITYHYLHMDPSRAVPVLIGFMNEVERDFFLQFITVSGIGPRSAVKAINKPISEIASAIDEGNINFLKTLPGIGLQRAKEIVAKLQGKVGKFGLIQDKVTVRVPTQAASGEWQAEALEVLTQLQYKKHEALEMIHKALERSPAINTTEGLLNEIYKQKVRR